MSKETVGDPGGSIGRLIGRPFRPIDAMMRLNMMLKKRTTTLMRNRSYTLRACNACLSGRTTLSRVPMMGDGPPPLGPSQGREGEDVDHGARH